MYFAKNKNGEVMPQYTELVRATFPNVFTIAAQRTKLKFAQQYQLNITVFAGVSDNARFRALVVIGTFRITLSQTTTNNPVIGSDKITSKAWIALEFLKITKLSLCFRTATLFICSVHAKPGDWERLIKFLSVHHRLDTLYT